MHHGHDGQQVADVKAAGGRVIANIKRDRTLLQTGFDVLWMCHLLDKAARLQCVKYVFHGVLRSFIGVVGERYRVKNVCSELY